MSFCVSCNADNAEGLFYCVRCGKRLEPPAPGAWRGSGNIGPTQTEHGGAQPAYQPPPAYQNNPAPAYQNNPAYAPPAPYGPAYPAPVAVAAAPANATGQLSQVGMTLSIVVACLALIGLVPCVGWLNWFALIFGKITLVMCIIAVATEKDPNRRSKAVIGLMITSVALGVAIIRLILSLVFGAGCL